MPVTLSAFRAPLLDATTRVAWREALRAAGRTVVFTNGVFDLLHAGHVAYLAWARAQGDALIVLVNEDASVRLLERPGPPARAVRRSRARARARCAASTPSSASASARRRRCSTALGPTCT